MFWQLIADIHYEILVPFNLTKASGAESPVLSRMIQRLFSWDRRLAEPCADFSAERSLDGGALKQVRWEDHDIRPLIDTQEKRREEKAVPFSNTG